MPLVSDLEVRVSGPVARPVPSPPGVRYLVDSGPSERGTHRLMSFLHCPTLYAYLYELDLAADGRRPLVLGSLTHTGLAHYYGRLGAAQQGGMVYIHTERQLPGDPPVYSVPMRVTDPEVFYDPIESVYMAADLRAQEGGVEGRLATVLKDQAAEMVRKVMDKEAKHGRPFRRVLGVEVPVELRTGEHKITTKLDLITEVIPVGSRTPKRRVVDHKTAARPGDQATLDKYVPTLQLAVMRVVGRKLFKDLYDGTYLHLVDSVGDTGGRMLQPAPAPHIERKVLDLLLEVEQNIARLKVERPDPWSWPMAANEQSCTSPYGAKKRCEGWELCTAGPVEGEFRHTLRENRRAQETKLLESSD